MIVSPLAARRLGYGFAVLLLILTVLPPTARAQAPAAGPAALATGEYQIGIEDVLEISVWSHPELERSVSVGPQGTIIVPPIGEVKAAGLTTRQLADRLADRLSAYLRQGAANVTVVVHDYLSQSVFVNGAVTRPGRYGAERPPSIIDALNQAGGALTGGDLNRVTIIHRSGPGPREVTVDVANAMRLGTESTLPALRAGDMIVVPTAVSLVGGVGNEQGIGVLGEVDHPGLYPVGDHEDLWMALALAGGPTARSNLATIRVITHDQTASTAVLVNLKDTLTRGNRRPYIVQPGDIVFVDAKGIGAWEAFSRLLSTTRDVASIIAVVEVLKHNH